MLSHYDMYVVPFAYKNKADEEMFRKNREADFFARQTLISLQKDRTIDRNLFLNLEL